MEKKSLKPFGHINKNVTKRLENKILNNKIRGKIIERINYL